MLPLLQGSFDYNLGKNVLITHLSGTAKPAGYLYYTSSG